LAISVSERKENKQRLQTAVTNSGYKQRLQTLQTNNAWYKKLNCFNLTFRLLQYTSSQVSVITITKSYKFKTKARHWWQAKKINNRIDTSGKNY